ncbi:MAG: NADH-quinone oxidoreductase subunit NuoK [Candidatus Sericytochromatia bacterium]|nr:NADH-quinone oxidoreductase subunit NuoK [Candidatus Sericytochromatia bacterium]
MVPTSHFLIVSAALFCIGLAGFVARRNLFIIFMSVELMLNGVNLSFLAFARHLGDLGGHIFTFLVIALAAAEAAIGLAIVILIFKNAGETAESDALSVDNYQALKH